MSPALQVALAIGPLAAYFGLLGLLQSLRRPTVVPGTIDFALLAGGLGGLVVFGPVGWVLGKLLFPGPSLWARLALLSGYVLLVMIWAPRSGRRLVIYNVDPRSLVEAVREGVERLDPGAHFEPTVRGFEDHALGRGLHLEPPGRLRTAVIDAYGNDPETLIASLEPILRRELARHRSARSPLAGLWFALGLLTLISPLAALALSRPGVMTAVRTFLDHLVGG
jgi:hypothetical protein